MGQIILFAIMIFNLLAILVMILKERKKPEIIISWLLLFSLLPIVGFVFYILIGSGLSLKNKRMLKKKKFYNDNYTNYFHELVFEDIEIENPKASKLIKFNMRNGNSVPTFGNKVQFFTDGNKKIDALIEDIKSAKHSINLEYYIFGDDKIGDKVMAELIKKAEEGVVVNLIYDSVGSLKTSRRYFKKLRRAGGHVKEFFPPLFYIRLINFKMNYRNHRKIAVIDGKIGYVGGINIREDHCGFVKKVAPWCDAHVRVEGQAVYTLQNEFLNFWQFCNKENLVTNKYYELGYFPDIDKCGETVMQTLASGPDLKGHEIKENMQKMFYLAEREIILQTPYFVPDDIFMNAIKSAINSGVKVRVIIPGKPDKKFVYNATMSFSQELLEMGGEVYLYDGFMHAKALVADDFAMTIGTANADNRSFELNFEINTVIYDKKEIENYKNYLNEILNNCQQIDIDYFKQKPFWVKFKQLFFRLFAPLF